METNFLQVSEIFMLKIPIPIVIYLILPKEPELFHPQTQSLWLTVMAHHHLAIAFIFLVADHMYRTNFGIGHNMKDF
ncbi:hypothetical protein RJ639_029852 [Escallonia herrerae]|uniref:Uncharacterized protein n=1 Tax=Escallonia herrerae TaxID=1293975 RepID=A0AA89BCJ1_9ASTE|nr:hypothetical protein RJ639_029852 [Escallonia herrerae]